MLRCLGVGLSVPGQEGTGTAVMNTVRARIDSVWSDLPGSGGPGARRGVISSQSVESKRGEHRSTCCLQQGTGSLVPVQRACAGMS